MRALIVDQSRDRSSLAAARALHADGWVVGSGAWRPSLASKSRHVAHYHRVEEAGNDEDRFIADIAAAVEENGYEVVLCNYDLGLLTLSRRRAEIAPAVVPYADHEVVERMFDKAAFGAAAEAAGLGVPRTVAATDEALAAWSGPVAVKARLHTPRRHETRLYDSADDARDFVAMLSAAGAQPLLQERLEGRLGAVVVVVDRSGRVISELHQICDRTWPAEVGITARGQVIAIDPRLAAQVSQLVAATGWFGLAQIQFLLGADGVHRFLDFNGRLYGSVALAQAAGVNVVAQWARLATGRPISIASVPRIGQRFQWLNRDVAASRHAAGWKGVAGALSVAPRAAHSIGTLGDPGVIVRFLAPELVRRVSSRLVQS